LIELSLSRFIIVLPPSHRVARDLEGLQALGGARS